MKALFWISLSLLFFSSTGNAQPTAPYYPPNERSEYLTVVQQHTFRYFWDFAHPVSAMAPERTATPNVVTSGGTGFGVMAWVVGAYRGWITRDQALDQTLKLVGFLEKAERFHGAWSHWLDGTTGKAVPFSKYDDGGDLVETAYLINGLLSARAYFDGDSKKEKDLRKRITDLYESVEWDWYAHNGMLHWHWSANYGWKMNHGIGGYNECLITYILAMGSPTHPISEEVYRRTWKEKEPGHYLNGKQFFGYTLPLGFDYGGPLFFAHYSYLSIDPKKMEDSDANYWKLNVAHTLINRAYCIEKAPKPYGYSEKVWGLTASDNHQFYGAHNPEEDNGTITPTAALSSFPYTPYYSMQVMMHLYRNEGNRLFGPYGFYDSFNKVENWYSNQYLAIDQGPIVVMMENYRSGLLWKLGEKTPELWRGMERMGMRVPAYATGFYAWIPEARSGRVDLMRHVDRYQYDIDFAVKGNAPVSLGLISKEGKEMLLIENKALAEGVHVHSFDTEPGDYEVFIRQSGTDIRQKVRLNW